MIPEGELRLNLQHYCCLNMQNYINTILRHCNLKLILDVNIPIDNNIVISPSSKYKCIYHTVQSYSTIVTVYVGTTKVCAFSRQEICRKENLNYPQNAMAVLVGYISVWKCSRSSKKLFKQVDKKIFFNGIFY